MTALAKITSKGQTTIPKEVRDALQARPGDLLASELAEDCTVTVRRVRPMDLEYLQAVQGTLSEWASPEDETTYRDL